jgi:hypothetical protein
MHHRRVGLHRLPAAVGRIEADLVEQPFRHGGQTADADVLSALVDVDADRELTGAAAKDWDWLSGESQAPAVVGRSAQAE